VTDTVQAFFYGLYMDSELLRSLGFVPGSVIRARLDSYALDLFGLAKIIPNNNSVVWGNVISVSEQDLTAMYSFETTKSYKAESVQVFDIDGNAMSVNCYNTAASPNLPFNSEYQLKLVKLLKKLEFPVDYIASVNALN